MKLSQLKIHSSPSNLNSKSIGIQVPIPILLELYIKGNAN